MNDPPELSRRILAALAVELCPHRRSWGEHPDLLFLAAAGPDVHARPLGLPPFIWSGRTPSAVLAGIATAAEEMMAAWSVRIPPGLLGAGLRCEAMVLADLPVTEVTAMTPDMVRAHPGAVLGRFACAVDRNGVTYGVETDHHGSILGGRIVVPGERHTAATGTIPDALDRILTALLGIDLPTRPTEYPTDDPEVQDLSHDD